MFAIHDATYSSRPRTWRELRWRMRFIFEERVGKRISEAELQAAAQEEAAWQAAKGKVG